MLKPYLPEISTWMRRSRLCHLWVWKNFNWRKRLERRGILPAAAQRRQLYHLAHWQLQLLLGIVQWAWMCTVLVSGELLHVHVENWNYNKWSFYLRVLLMGLLPWNTVPEIIVYIPVVLHNDDMFTVLCSFCLFPPPSALSHTCCGGYLKVGIVLFSEFVFTNFVILITFLQSRIEFYYVKLIFLLQWYSLKLNIFKSIHIWSVTLFTSIKVNGPFSVTSALNLLVLIYPWHVCILLVMPLLWSCPFDAEADVPFWWWPVGRNMSRVNKYQ
jgi:hypothetical protein